MRRFAVVAFVLLAACGTEDPVRSQPVPPERVQHLYELRERMEKVLRDERSLYERATREKSTASPERVRAWLDAAQGRGREAEALVRKIESAQGELRDGYGWEDPYSRNFKRHSAVMFDLSSRALDRFVAAPGPAFAPGAPGADPPSGRQPSRISLAPLADSAADGRLCARQDALRRRFGNDHARTRVQAGGRELEYRFDVRRDYTERGAEPVYRVVSYSVDLGAAVAFRDLAESFIEFAPALERPVVICQSVEDRESMVVVVDEDSERVQQVARVLAKAPEKRPLPPYGIGYVLELTKATRLEQLAPDTGIWSVRKVTTWPRPGHPSWKRLSRSRGFPDGLAAFFR